MSIFAQCVEIGNRQIVAKYCICASFAKILAPTIVVSRFKLHYHHQTPFYKMFRNQNNFLLKFADQFLFSCYLISMT